MSTETDTESALQGWSRQLWEHLNVLGLVLPMDEREFRAAVEAYVQAFPPPRPKKRGR